MRSDIAERGQKSLRVSGRCEPFHCPFSLPGRLVRVLCPVVQVFRSAMLNRGQYLAVCDTVASQLVCNDHSRHILQSFEQSVEEFLSRQRISA